MPKLENTKRNKPVTVICSGRSLRYKKRQDAFDLFWRCMKESEGAENYRYQTILVKLEESDKNIITDED